MDAIIGTDGFSRSQTQKEGPKEPPSAAGKHDEATKNEKESGELLSTAGSVFDAICRTFGIGSKKSYENDMKKEEPTMPPFIAEKRHKAAKNKQELVKLLYKTGGIFGAIYRAFGVHPKRFYENGVEIVAPEGMKTIFYSDLAAMSYTCGLQSGINFTQTYIGLYFKPYDGTEYCVSAVNCKRIIEKVQEKINE